jgi:hypothetical protein
MSPSTSPSFLRTAACAGALALMACAAAAAAPTALDVALTPHLQAGEVDGLAVALRIEAPGVAAGQPLLRMPTRIVSTPTAAYDAAAIHARDALGELPLHVLDEAPTPTGNYRQYLADRATSGDVQVEYAAPARAVDSTTRNGPLFDLRKQAGGLMGAGVYFLALPPDEAPHTVHLAWHLDGLPPGARGVWSVGEGDQTTVLTTEALAFSFYAVGNVHSEPEQGVDKFGLYWLAEPPFDMRRLAADTRRLHDYMAHFFRDESGSYRVFARANPYPAGGGTALLGSFMFGYGNGNVQSPKELQILLAHEMAHNWPKTTADEEHAATAWYTEGTAEYYSSALSYRAGIIDLARFTEIVNERADLYYANPLRALTNVEVGKRFWSEDAAQRVPYGRGFMYLARLDAQVRAKSHGRRSVDDLVLAMAAAEKRGEKMGNVQWRALVVKELGAAAGGEYDDMVVGKPIEPAAGSFGPCLRPERTTVRPFELGFDRLRLGVVSQLQPGSAAALAGLKEGDIITAMTPLEAVRNDPKRLTEVSIRRGESLDTIRYLARGPETPTWHWVRVDGVPDASCKL